MNLSAQLLSSSLSGCGRKLVGFALKVQVSGDLWSPAVVPSSQRVTRQNVSIFIVLVPALWSVAQLLCDVKVNVEQETYLRGADVYAYGGRSLCQPD